MTQIIRTNAKTRSNLWKLTRKAGALLVVGTAATGFGIATRYDDMQGSLALLTGKKIKTQKAAIAKASTYFRREPTVLKGHALPA